MAKSRPLSISYGVPRPVCCAIFTNFWWPRHPHENVMSFFAILLAFVLEQARPLKTDNQVFVAV